MQVTIKMIIASILSILVGIAFASPLFYSDTRGPLIYGVRGGPTADMRLDFAYADFQVQVANADVPFPRSFPANETAYILTYYVVLNVTNNCDNAAMIGSLSFQFARTAISLSEFLYTQVPARVVRVNGAWVDGIWYNATWVKGLLLYPFADHTGLPAMASYRSLPSTFQPYLESDVFLYDRYVNSSIVATYMDMNGTWVDVTGRINVTRPEIPQQTIFLGTVASEMRLFEKNRGDVVMAVGTSQGTFTRTGPDMFNNTWNPHETRLVLFRGTRVVNSSVVDTLDSGKILVEQHANHFLVPQMIDGTLTTTYAIANFTGQIQLQRNGDHYVYNNILSSDQMFVPDQYNVEVTVEPRR
jgi:hypothetical protein